MTECDADVLQILVSQIAENAGINIVIGKTQGVLGHAELFEPVRNWLHRGHQQFWHRSEASQKAYTNISTMARFAYVAQT